MLHISLFTRVFIIGLAMSVGCKGSIIMEIRHHLLDSHGPY